MSVTTLDPIEKLIEAAVTGKSIIKNRTILHHAFIPDYIPHRDGAKKCNYPLLIQKCK